MSNHYVSKVDKIQFGVLDPEYIRKMSVVQVKHPEIFGDGSNLVPKPNGLFDLKMGPIEDRIPCPTCGYKREKCNGHFGHIELGAPVYHPGFIDDVVLLLRCVCHECSRLLVDRKDIKIRKLKHVAKLAKKKQYRTCGCADDHATETTNDDDDEEDETLDTEVHDLTEMQSALLSESTLDNDLSTGCGAKQKNYCKEGIKIFETTPKAKPQQNANNENDQPNEPQPTEKTKKEITPLRAFRILEKITDRDAQYLGFSKFSKPHWLIITALPVPPPCVRPSVQMDSSRRGEDDLTQKLIEILKSNNSYITKERDGAPTDFVANLFNLLRWHVATFIHNEIPGVEKAQQRSKRDIKAIVQRLKGKEGRVRQNLMGKRVNQSARTVIDPDPTLGIQELGMPLKIATTLTFNETVNEMNRDYLMQFVRNGEYRYPGANAIIKGGNQEETYLLRNCSDPLILDLKPGDVVQRHLIDGDPIVFNRQPTLHRPSMMGHKTKVMKNASSFRTNLAVCCPYNSDYDGAEIEKNVQVLGPAQK